MTLRTCTAVALLLAAVSIKAGSAEIPAFASGISAGTIAIISDGDFLAQSYASGRLAPVEAGHRDLLTVIGLSAGKTSIAQLPLSNSVTAAPEILALARDGSVVFVTERLAERTAGAQVIRDLAPGRRLFAVDLADKTAPRLADTAQIEPFPESLAVSPDGARIALVSNTPEASFIQIVPFVRGRFGQVVRFRLDELGITGTASGPRGGVLATNVQWHPSGRFIAVNINTQNRVVFFEVMHAADTPQLRPWGNVVEVGTDPMVGRFTPDGRYYLTSNWGRNFTATDLEGRIPRTASTISVIRLAKPTADAELARHERLAHTVTTDQSAEGLAVSPDGTLVATVNMRDTAFPPESPRFQREASVSLLRFEAATGKMVKIADYPFEGVLPEGGVFDLTGDHFLATVFQGHAGATASLGSGLEVFRVIKGNRPALRRLGRIPLPHGVHHVDVAR